MKKHLILIVFLLFSTLTFGQQNYQDVVYLKNGSIIRGIIIEQVINKSIKIETADRNVFVFKMDEIEKLTKEIDETRKRKIGNNQSRGYIGLTLGTSIPLNDFADESNGLASTGLHINLVNFGYLFTENFGMTANWFGASNPIDDSNIDPWSYGGLSVGPLLSFPATEKIVWDIKPMIGYSVTTIPDIGYGTEAATSVAFNFGVQMRSHVSNHISLLISADYFSTKPEFIDYNIKQEIETFILGFGVAYRLK